MFIAIVKYKKSLSEVDKYLQAHRDYLSANYEKGYLIASGPQNPRAGGVIMIKAINKESVDKFISRDPFFINDIAEYQIVEFTPTMFFSDELKDILNT